MTKLYYTNPLIAAYMAEEFEIRYLDNDGNDIWFHHVDTSFGYSLQKAKLLFQSKENNAKASIFHPELTFNTQRKAYIHPDSLDIFEPKIWDVVEWDGIMYGDVIGKNENIIGIQHGKSDVYMVDINEITILQRNNKPFFVPENEE